MLLNKIHLRDAMNQKENRRLKVLFIASWYPNREYPVSGIFVKRHAISVSRYCEVAVLHIHIGEVDSRVEVLEEDGILEVLIYRNINTYPSRLLGAISKLAARYLIYWHCTSLGYGIISRKVGRPDLVHANVLLWAGFAALYLKLRYGIPYIITEHWSGYFSEDGSYHRSPLFGKALIKIIGKKANAITVVSHKLRHAMMACGIKNDYFIIPNVVEVTPPHRGKKNKNNIKQILHVSFFGDEIKNVSGIIEAVKILSRRRRDFELHIVGDGSDRLKLQDLAKRYGLLNNLIFFEGMVDANEISEFYHGCDFFVLYSNFETFSVVTAEALVCGKPVIATRCGGPEEFVNEDCGILIEPRNNEALVKAIDFMLDNYSCYKSNEIREYARNRFGYDEVGREFLRIYQKVMEQQGI